MRKYVLSLHSTLFLNQTLLGYVSLNERSSEAHAPEHQLSLISVHVQPGCCREMLLLVKSCLTYQPATTFKEYFFSCQTCHILEVSVTLELGISSVEPVKGGFVLLNFNGSRMQLSLAGRNSLWVSYPEGLGETCVYVGRGCVGGGVFRVRARLWDPKSQLRGVSEISRTMLLVLSASDSGFWFSFSFAPLAFFFNNLRHCTFKYFNFSNTMDTLSFKNLATTFSFLSALPVLPPSPQVELL